MLPLPSQLPVDHRDGEHEREEHADPRRFGRPPRPRASGLRRPLGREPPAAVKGQFPQPEIR